MLRKKVLLACYGGGHANMILPVYNELRKNPRLDIAVMAFTTARLLFDKAEVPYFSFKDTSEFKTSRRAAELGEQFANETSNLLPREETVAYMGCSLEELFRTYGEDEARRLFYTYGRNAFLPIAFFESILKRECYDLVVTTNSPRSEKALVFASQRLDIPSVVIVDLFSHKEFVDRTSHAGYGTKVCVLNNYAKNELIKLGRPPNEIIVTGNPAFDKLADSGLEEAAQSLRLQRGWNDKKVILWARCADADSLQINSMIERRLEEYAFKNMNATLVIRPHPNENIDTLQLPAHAFISRRTDLLPPLLHASDLVVTTLSTVGLEGALIGKPLIQIRMTRSSYDSPYVELGLAKGVTSLDELEETIESIFKLGNLPSHTKTYLPVLGKAASAVAETICTLL